jgi:hypothetical protein
MSCEELLRLLDEEGDITTPEAAAHLASCPDCAAALQLSRAVRQELASMAAEPAPAFLHTRIMATVRAEARVPRRWTATKLRLAWSPAVVLAAFAILIVGGGSLFLLRDRVARPDLGYAPSPALATQAAPAQESKAADKLQDELRAKAGREEALAKDKGVAPRPTAPVSQASPSVVQSQAASWADHPQPEAPARVVASDELGAARQRRTQVTSALPAAPAPPEAQAPSEKRDLDEVSPSPLVAVGADENASRGPMDQPEAEKKERSLAGAAAAKTAPQAAFAAREAVTVSCVLLDEAGRLAGHLTLPPELAPPPHETWQLAVAEGELVRALDGRGAPLPGSRRDALARQLAPLQLPPGSYSLSRSASH